MTSPLSDNYNTITTSTIFQFPQNGSWIENIASRRNGNLLITRLDVPELWSIDPKQKTASLVHSFSNVSSLCGISEIREDVFAIAGITFDAATGTLSPGSGTIFIADMKSGDFKRIGSIAGSLVLNGLTAFDSQIVLVGDSTAGILYKFHVDNGAYSIVSEDEALKGRTGVNGVKLHESDGQKYVYFTSSTQSKIGRIPLTADGSAGGPVEITATIPDTFLDDFVLTGRGVAFVATGRNNTVLRAAPNGQTSTVVGSLDSLEVAGGTSLAWGVGEKELYVATSGGQSGPVNGTLIEPAKVVKLVFR